MTMTSFEGQAVSENAHRYEAKKSHAGRITHTLVLVLLVVAALVSLIPH